MTTETTDKLASKIAEKLTQIKSLIRKRASVRNQIEDVAQESNKLSEELNRIEDTIKSLKYEISNDLNDTNLTVVNGD